MYLHVLSRHDTASSSQSVAKVLAVPAASNAHTGPVGGATHLPAQSGGGTPSRTLPRSSSAGCIASSIPLGLPTLDGRNGRLADCTSHQAEMNGICDVRQSIVFKLKISKISYFRRFFLFFYQEGFLIKKYNGFLILLRNPVAQLQIQRVIYTNNC